MRTIKQDVTIAANVSKLAPSCSFLQPSIVNYDISGAHHLLKMYGGYQFTTLDELGAHLYCSLNVKDLSSLPPTENAFYMFYQHICFV